MPLTEMDIPCVFPQTIPDFCVQWNGFAKDPKGKGIWNLWILVIWWSIWLVRNSRLFQNYVESLYMVYRRVRKRCFYWVFNCKEFVNWSIIDIKVSWVNIVSMSLPLHFFLWGWPLMARGCLIPL